MNLNLIGSDSLIDNLYMLDAICSYDEIPQTNWSGTKWKLNENSATLWHKCLGHMSKQNSETRVE